MIKLIDKTAFMFAITIYSIDLLLKEQIIEESCSYHKNIETLYH